ncbi:hypothetical protein EG68_08050 [Paragonimus skrjabini miyazakii]|uniref:Otopetrin n=1 Tax=Paragonimus skrjabini miyazakii TaxID=59628 RepID=A0A8S9YBU0_9TREM|nr:hypothetical protein EG68_08050 [Paragonimus skrjabini miyazakii]
MTEFSGALVTKEPLGPMQCSSHSSLSSDNHGTSTNLTLISMKRRAELFKLVTRAKVQKAWRLIRVRKSWEKDMHKQKALPAPFVSVHVKDKRGSMRASFLLIFAMIQCICGFVFPICDAFALTDKWTQFAINHKYYLEGFSVFQHIGAIMFLAYLQLLIMWFGISTENNFVKHGSMNRRSDMNQRLFSERPPKRLGRFEIRQVDENQQRFIFTRPDLSLSSGDLTRTSHKSDNAVGCLGRSLCCRHKSNRPTKRKTDHVTLHKDGMNVYMRLGAVGFGLGVMIHDGFNLSSAWELGEPSCHSLLWVPKHLLRLIWVLWQTYFIFKFHRIVLNVQKFWVRMAFTHLAVVNLCHWLKVVVGEISDTLKHIEATADGSASIVQDILAYVFSKYGFESGETKVNVHGLPLLQNSSFVAANVSNLAGEVRKHVDLYTQYHRPQVNCQAHLGNTLKPFLFPLIIEYCLITGTLFYKMLQRVGQRLPFKSNISGRLPITSVEVLGERAASVPSLNVLPSAISTARSCGTGVMKHNGLKEKACERHTYYRQLLGCRVYLPPLLDDFEEEQVQVCSPQACDPNSIINTIQTRLRRRYRDSHCHRSHTGLFLGLMIFTASCIGISFFLGRNKINLLRFTPNIYQHWKIFVLSASLLASVLALIQTNQLKFRRRKSSESFEYSLLGLGLLGYLAFYMLLFVPSLEAIVHVYLYGTTADQTEAKLKAVDRMNTLNLDRLVGTAWLYMGKSVLEIVQVLAQFFLIIEASRRGPCCANQAAIKPGRSTIVFLLIANLALWLVNTFEARHTEQHLILYKHYFGLRTWSIITCCFIPLIIFFRFHSTVCLAQIWSSLYKLE